MQSSVRVRVPEPVSEDARRRLVLLLAGFSASLAQLVSGKQEGTTE